MGDVMFHIFAIGVAALGVVRGYRRGLTGMVTCVLGMAFGIVCSHIFIDGVTEAIEGMLPVREDYIGGHYVATNVAAGLIFGAVYFVFRLVTRVIRDAMPMEGGGLLNSLLGTAFCVYNYLLMLSIVYNVMVGWDPGSRLMHDGKADDGNIISAVMWIAPAALGSESFSEFAHEEQLHQAKKISMCNRREGWSV